MIKRDFKSKWTQEDLQKILDDPRPRNRMYQRKSADVVYESEATKHVSKETGFAYVHVREIISTYQKFLRQEILKKRRVRIEGLCSLQVSPRLPRPVNKFVDKKIVGKYLSDPIFSLNLFPNATLKAEVKKIELVLEDMEVMYEDENKVPWDLEERKKYFEEQGIDREK